MNDEEYIAKLKSIRSRLDYCIGLINTKDYYQMHKQALTAYTDLHYYLIDSRKRFFPHEEKKR